MDIRWTLHMEETWRAVLIQVLAALAWPDLAAQLIY